MSKPLDFTIAFIAHNDFEIASRTIPQNITALTENTSLSYSTVLVLDGFELFDTKPYIDKMSEWGVDEIRLRSRKRICADGDPSNNGHLFLPNANSHQIIEIESDVAVFRTNLKEPDILKSLSEYFNRRTDQCIATKVNDYECWQWQLEKVAKDIEAGVWSVNRLSSHFFTYVPDRFFEHLERQNVDLTTKTFYDDGENWLNYEDFLSNNFAKPKGPGIGFLHSFPFNVYHCDEKTRPGSPFYKKDIDLKCRIFDHLRRRYQ